MNSGDQVDAASVLRRGASDTTTTTIRSAPLLPAGRSDGMPTLTPHVRTSASATAAPSTRVWYRSEEQRFRSVARRANPWYRQLARGVIALGLVGVIGLLALLGAQGLQSYVNRDRLPGPGAEAVPFRTTRLLITSRAPAPAVEGTLTIDTTTRAFTFVGRPGADAPQAGWEIMSPDGASYLIREPGGTWAASDASNPIVAEVAKAIPYVIDIRDADDVLLPELRKGYIALSDKAVEGVGTSELDRYEMSVDTRRFATNNPIDWQAMQAAVIPGVRESGGVPVTLWIDQSDVVVRLRDGQTNWAWQRLDYGEQPFTPDRAAESAPDSDS